VSAGACGTSIAKDFDSANFRRVLYLLIAPECVDLSGGNGEMALASERIQETLLTCGDFEETLRGSR
jgi:hypothetical protein